MPARSRLVVPCLAVALALLTPAPAHAERWASSDDEGDVTGRLVDPEPEPCGTSTAVDASGNTNDDITRLVVSHQRRVVKVVVRFRDLDPQQGQHVAVHLDSGTRGWFLDVRRFRDFDTDVFQVSAFLAREPELPGDGEADDCGAVVIVPTGCHVRPRIDLSGNALRADVPRSCLRHPRWVRAGVRTSGGGAAPVNSGGYLAYADEWGEGSGAGWRPPFGPKVTAPRGARLGHRGR